jgi:hypothetical protein
VAFDILSEAHKPLTLDEILARARERELVGEELAATTLATAIAEENRRRTDSGRRPAFTISEAGTVEIIEGPPEAPPERDGERRPAANRWAQQINDARRNATRLTRRRVAELDAGGLERLAAQLLERSGYRDCRAVKRAGREGSLLTARRKLGLTELRFAIRLAPNGIEVSRELVRELRRDMLLHGAHAAIVMSPGDVGREARAEALIVGQPLVTLLCGEALAEELVLRQVGSQLVEICYFDDGFWKTLRRSPAVPGGEPRVEPGSEPVREPEAQEAKADAQPDGRAEAPPAGAGSSTVAEWATPADAVPATPEGVAIAVAAPVEAPPAPPPLEIVSGIPSVVVDVAALSEVKPRGE